MPHQNPQPASAIMRMLTIIATLCAFILTAFAGYAIGRASPTLPAQTTNTETITLGDVKRYCITIKTGDRIDAIDCNLIDDMTGQVR